MRILAIDPSFTRAGVCAHEGVTMSVAAQGPKVPVHERIADLCDRVLGTGDYVRRSFDLVVIEECFMHRFADINSIWLHGELRRRVVAYGLPYADIGNSTRAKWACGDQKGRDKDEVLARAIRAGSPARNNDEADAWWLHQIATTAYEPPADDLQLYRREVLATVKWPEVRGIQPTWVKPKKTTKKKEQVPA